MNTQKKKILNLFWAFFLLQISFSQNIFYENFENGQGFWQVTNGSFQVGTPSTGVQVYEGNNVAGTILNGNYPTNANSYLVSPNISLPTVDEEQRIELDFWHYYDIGFVAKAHLSISLDNGDSWIILSNDFDDDSGIWSKYKADLTAYQGMEIKLGYYFSSSIHPTRLGYYLDEIRIDIKNNSFTGNTSFEQNDSESLWYATNGIWGTGTSTTCTSPNEGTSVMATVPEGNYPTNANSRLVSPTIHINENAEHPFLKFQHWYDLGFVANGWVQVSVNNGNWENIGTELNDASGGWVQFGWDLSEYKGNDIRFGFLISSSIHPTRCGWYIDSFEIIGAGSPVSTSEIKTAHKIQVYPNPIILENHIQFELTQKTIAHISLLDINGKKTQSIFNGIFNPGNSTFSWQPLDHLNPGIYYLQIILDKEILHQPLIISKP